MLLNNEPIIMMDRVEEESRVKLSTEKRNSISNSCCSPRSSCSSSNSCCSDDSSSLEIFDPYDQLDNVLVRPAGFKWLNKPTIISRLETKRNSTLPQAKYRISIDATDLVPSSICLIFDNDQQSTNNPQTLLIITARLKIANDEIENDNNNQKKEDKDEQQKTFISSSTFTRVFKLPRDLVLTDVAAFVTFNGQLVVDIPFARCESEQNESSESICYADKEMTKSTKTCVVIRFKIPEDISEPSTSNVRLFCKDTDLILRVEDRLNREHMDTLTHVYYYRRVCLPENDNDDDYAIDLGSIQCTYDKRSFVVTAARLNTSQHETEEEIKHIPIEIIN